MMKKLLCEFKKKFLKFLPQQPVASLTIQNPTTSPSRSVRSPVAQRVSIVPKEARRNSLRGASFGVQEPGSPKVTCLGQVHPCKKKRKAATKRQQQKRAAADGAVPVASSKNFEKVEKERVLLCIFKGTGDEETEQSGKAFVLEDKVKVKVNDDKTPSAGAMKKFSSGRGALSHLMPQ